MSDALARLLSLKVGDIAQREVVTLSAHDGMVRAAAKLLAHEVSGAPVVDEQGRLVGILSAVDYLRRSQSCDAPRLTANDNAWTSPSNDRPVAIEDPPHDFCSRFMSTGVQTIAAEATLLKAAEIMCSEHVHRLPVVDPSGRPTGVITSLDIVAALFNAVEEHRTSSTVASKKTLSPA